MEFEDSDKLIRALITGSILQWLVSVRLTVADLDNGWQHIPKSTPCHTEIYE
jgi:hypothetical protein